MSRKSEPLFHEEQGLAQARVKIALATVPLICLGLIAWQIVLGHPWGRRPVSNTGLIGWTIILGLVYWRLITVKLVTDLGPDKLSISMRGLWRVHHVPLALIENVEVVTFDAAKDFGGFGMRSVGRTKAYVARGCHGVRLKLNRGAAVVIGSQRADELAGAIQAIRKG